MVRSLNPFLSPVCIDRISLAIFVGKISTSVKSKGVTVYRFHWSKILQVSGSLHGGSQGFTTCRTRQMMCIMESSVLVSSL